MNSGGDEFTESERERIRAWDEENISKTVSGPDELPLVNATIAVSRTISDARDVAPGGELDPAWALGVARKIAEERKLSARDTERLIRAAEFFALPVGLDEEPLSWPLGPALEESDDEAP